MCQNQWLLICVNRSCVRYNTHSFANDSLIIFPWNESYDHFGFFFFYSYLFRILSLPRECKSISERVVRERFDREKYPLGVIDLKEYDDLILIQLFPNSDSYLNELNRIVHQRKPCSKNWAFAFVYQLFKLDSVVREKFAAE